jgi:hypothetical protein
MLRKYTIFIVALIALIAFSDTSYAGGGKRNGTAGAQEILIPVSARGLALSGANISGIQGLNAIYYNPAGFGASEGTEAMFTYMNYIADIGMTYAALGVHLGDIGAIAFSIRTLDFGDIPVTTVAKPYGTGSTFSPTFVVAGITYSNSLTDRIRVGLNVNFVSEQIIRTNATGVSFDAGVQYSGLAGLDGLSMGVVLRNLGPKMKFSGSDLIRSAEDPNGIRGPQFYSIDAASFELPSQLELGVTYIHRFDDSYKAMIATSFQNNNFANDAYKFAGEFSFNDMFFVRGGYRFVSENTDDTDQSLWGPTFGFGVNVETGVDITVDYAYRSVDYFDANHMISIILGF